MGVAKSVACYPLDRALEIVGRCTDTRQIWREEDFPVRFIFHKSDRVILACGNKPQATRNRASRSAEYRTRHRAPRERLQDNWGYIRRICARSRLAPMVSRTRSRSAAYTSKRWAA